MPVKGQKKKMGKGKVGRKQKKKNKKKNDVKDLLITGTTNLV